MAQREFFILSYVCSITCDKSNKLAGMDFRFCEIGRRINSHLMLHPLNVLLNNY